MFVFFLMLKVLWVFRRAYLVFLHFFFVIPFGVLLGFFLLSSLLSHNNNSVLCAGQSHLLWLSQSCWPCSWDCFTEWWWIRSCQCLPYTSEPSLSSPHPSGGLSRWVGLGWTSGAHKATLSLLSWAGQRENTMKGSWGEKRAGSDHSPVAVMDKTGLTGEKCNLLSIKSE